MRAKIVLISVVAAGICAATANAGPDLCVATGGGGDGSGGIRVQKGTAACVVRTPSPGNVAIARGDEATAIVGFETTKSRAKASGDDFATAQVGPGDGNVATANGDGSAAFATGGDGNTALATNGGVAAAEGGDGNTATATAPGSAAITLAGDSNTATATAADSTAIAGGGDGHTATATTEGCTASALTSTLTATC